MHVGREKDEKCEKIELGKSPEGKEALKRERRNEGYKMDPTT